VSPEKNISSIFHLLNTSAARETSAYLDGQCLRCDQSPTYLGVTLTYRELLTNSVGKACPRGLSDLNHCAAVHMACVAVRPRRFGVQIQVQQPVGRCRSGSPYSETNISGRHRGFDGVLFNL